MKFLNPKTDLQNFIYCTFIIYFFLPGINGSVI